MDSTVSGDAAAVVVKAVAVKTPPSAQAVHGEVPRRHCHCDAVVAAVVGC